MNSLGTFAYFLISFSVNWYSFSSFLAESEEKVNVYFSAVNEKGKKDYILFEGGNVEASIGDNFLKISKGVAEFKSHSGEIQKIIKNLAEFSEHLSKENQKAFSNFIA